MKSSRRAQRLIPALRFRTSNADEDLFLFKAFLRSDLAGRFHQEYPVLARRLKRLRSAREQDVAMYRFLRERQDQIAYSRVLRRFQHSWDRIHDKAMRVLSDVAEIEWPERYADFTVRITMSPTCPRYLDSACFDAFYRWSSHKLRAGCLHELLHFIWFEKWKQVFPRIPRREYDYPHRVWRLSELVTDCVLNDCRIQSLLKHQPIVYAGFRSLKVQGRPLLDCMQELYDSRDDFAEFQRRAYAFAKRHAAVVDKCSG